jgi:glycosyltransferase involved in cell wall biosynthesis
MKIFQKIVMRARARLAREVELCFLPNEERAKVFREQTKTKKPVECVWNVPRSEEICEQKKRPDPHDPLRIFYGGSLSSDRLPFVVLEEVVGLRPNIELNIVGYATYQHRELLNKIESYAGKDLLKFHGPKPREKMWAIADRCEAALCLMPKRSKDLNLQWMVGASNKPFDAMARGLAVVVSDIPEWKNLYLPGNNREGGKEYRISDIGYGIAINPESGESIRAGLEWMLNNREKLWEMGERGRLKIQKDWNYERLFQPVLDRLKVGNLESTA